MAGRTRGTNGICERVDEITPSDTADNSWEGQLYLVAYFSTKSDNIGTIRVTPWEERDPTQYVDIPVIPGDRVPLTVRRVWDTGTDDDWVIQLWGL